MAENGCLPVSMFKPFDRKTEKLVTVDPYIEDGTVYTVKVEAKTADELVAEAEAEKAKLIASVTQSVQSRLDDFAKTRNYDGILSLCTYATDTDPKFAAEGQYGVAARSSTWEKLYQILDEVTAGTRAAPTGFADIEPDLPALRWPV